MLYAKHSRAEANSQRSPISKRTVYTSLNSFLNSRVPLLGLLPLDVFLLNYKSS